MFANEIDVKNGHMGFEDLIINCVAPMMYAVDQLYDTIHHKLNTEEVEEIGTIKAMIFLERYQERANKLEFFSQYIFDNFIALKDKLDELGDAIYSGCSQVTKESDQIEIIDEEITVL